MNRSGVLGRWSGASHRPVSFGAGALAGEPWVGNAPVGGAAHLPSTAWGRRGLVWVGGVVLACGVGWGLRGAGSQRGSTEGWPERCGVRLWVGLRLWVGAPVGGRVPVGYGVGRRDGVRADGWGLGWRGEAWAPVCDVGRWGATRASWDRQAEWASGVGASGVGANGVGANGVGGQRGGPAGWAWAGVGRRVERGPAACDVGRWGRRGLAGVGRWRRPVGWAGGVGRRRVGWG